MIPAVGLPSSARWTASKTRVLKSSTRFYLDGEEWFVEEEGWFPLPIGAGVFSNEGRFFRVKDV
jgi:hypothetical protein